MRIEARAYARLHFGFLDVAGERGRRFGGLGLSLTAPRVNLEITPSDRLTVDGDQADRFARLAERHHEATGLEPRARIRILEAIPAHAGFGSGTQAALALGAGLDRLHRIERSPEDLCAMMGRGRRSGVGFHAFRQGGLVLEAGRASSDVDPRPAPLILRHPFPDDWRIVMAVPRADRIVSGESEESAFAKVRSGARGEVDAIAGLVLMRILPAVVERNRDAFGTALVELQDIIGAWFAPAQGGPYHPASAPILKALRDGGAAGVGQSSWGPLVYAFAGDDQEARRLCMLIGRTVPDAAISVARARNRGAEIEIA